MKLEERYQLLEKLASGSFATVYRAQDRELGREVAVKQIHEQFLYDPRQLERYWAEAQLLASLQHPNIITIYDLVRERGWLIMELMQANLADRMAGKPMDLVGLRTVLAHCLRALKFLHEHGVVHGDIKPSNMMIDRRKRVKIGDFGLARRVSDDEGSLLKGTTKYMAPEVVSEEFGEVGPASDLYSLGFSAYELMCGENFDSLFPGLNAHGRDKQLAWIMWHAAPDRRLPPISRVLQGVPEDLAKVIEKLCTKNRSQRYESADQALADLNVDLRVVRAEESKEMPNPGDAAAKRRRLLIIVAFCASLLSSLLILLPSGSDIPKPKVHSGLIREVRLDTREMIVVDEESGVPEIVKMGQKPSLLLKNTRQKILLEEVKAGDRVRISPRGNGVEYVLSRPILTNGILLRTDAVSKKVIIQTDDGAQRDEVPVQIVATAKLTLNGDEISFTDLQEQDRVSVEHLPDSRNENEQLAISVAARRTVRATGFIRTVNWQGKKMSFDVRQGATSRLMELPFAKGCQIILPGGTTTSPEELKADDLLSSDRVAVEFDTEITKVVATRNESLTGVVKAVNLETRLLTVQTRNSEHQLKVTDTTEIDLGGELSKLEGLRPYDETRITYQESDDGGGSQAVTIDATRPVKHDRIAIVIGVQNYDDKTVTRANYVLDDVQSLANTMRNRYCLAPERLFVLKDPDKATFLSKVSSALQNALGQTQVIIIFEGQAYEGGGGKYFLAPRDYLSSKPESAGIALDSFIELLEACPSHDKLLILDTFHTGSSLKYLNQPSPSKMLDSMSSRLKTTIAIAARGDGELAQEWPGKGHSHFMMHLITGFKGEADRDSDLHLTPQELLQHLRSGFVQPSFDKAQLQTPRLFGPS